MSETRGRVRALPTILGWWKAEADSTAAILLKLTVKTVANPVEYCCSLKTLVMKLKNKI